MDLAGTNAPDLLDRARHVVGVVEEYAQASEAGGTMAPELVQCFRDTELFWMLVPRELGGFETDILTAIDVWEEISRADASTGWSLMANSMTTAIAGAFLGDAAVQRMFGGPSRPIAGGMAGPGGTAVAEQGGYRGSGTYKFGSGCVHADWFCAGMMVAGDDGPNKLANGEPEVRVCFLPREEVVVKGNWDVFGLAGTGSIDYEVHDRFIGPGFSLERQDTRALRGGGGFDMGIAGFGMAGHTAVVLGLAKRALEEIAAIAAARKRPGHKAPLSEHPLFRRDYVLQDASYVAMRAAVHQVFGEAQQAAMSGSMTPLHVARMRQVLIYAHNVASDVVRFCHVQGGSDSLRNPSVLGRCMRDVHAATQHVFVDTAHLIGAAGPILATRRAGLDRHGP